jgi:hypothetical protein
MPDPPWPEFRRKRQRAKREWPGSCVKVGAIAMDWFAAQGLEQWKESTLDADSRRQRQNGKANAEQVAAAASRSSNAVSTFGGR